MKSNLEITIKDSKIRTIPDQIYKWPEKKTNCTVVISVSGQICGCLLPLLKLQQKYDLD